MSQALHATSSLKRQKGFFLKTYLANRIKEYLPRRIKRMIFLASVTAIMAQDKHDDKAIAAKLNAVLHIAYKDDATILPMYIKKWIWADLLKNPYIELESGKICLKDLCSIELKESDFARIGAFFRSIAPAWLVYGSENLICEDIKTVVDQVIPSV